MATQIRDGDFAMMGHGEGLLPKLFYHQMTLEERVSQGHILKRGQEKIDFDFIYGELKDYLGDKGWDV
jgi:hypothetical protein